MFETEFRSLGSGETTRLSHPVVARALDDIEGSL
jgi:hypothetical protein